MSDHYESNLVTQSSRYEKLALNTTTASHSGHFFQTSLNLCMCEQHVKIKHCRESHHQCVGVCAAMFTTV